MIVERNIIAILLETRPNKIEKIEHRENKIYIQLRDYDGQLSMNMAEYEACWQKLKSNNHRLNPQNLLTLTLIFGLFITATISSMNSNFLSDRHSPDNIELTADR